MKTVFLIFFCAVEKEKINLVKKVCFNKNSFGEETKFHSLTHSQYLKVTISQTPQDQPTDQITKQPTTRLLELLWPAKKKYVDKGNDTPLNKTVVTKAYPSPVYSPSPAPVFLSTLLLAQEAVEGEVR